MTGAEKARRWREANLERMREIRRESARRIRATLYQTRPSVQVKTATPPLKATKQPKQRTYIQRQQVGSATSIHNMGFKVHPKEYYETKTEVSLCTSCCRKYLTPLGCLFCR